jgi:hypothetical protein
MTRDDPPYRRQKTEVLTMAQEIDELGPVDDLVVEFPGEQVQWGDRRL